ncbi:hypothetical protein NX059_005875 [Plenodomus lindquistii]|nr:hypothetical protein NX059_005875 [Plenodomus lindquistii]
MCHTCRTCTLPEAEQALSKLTSNLQHIQNLAKAALAQAQKIEDQYRDDALLYHCSELRARQSIDPQRLQRLKVAFESDYSIVFATIDKLIANTIDLNVTVTHCLVSHGCTAARTKRYDEHILPTWAFLAATWTEQTKIFATLYDDASSLSFANVDFMQAQSIGLRTLRWFHEVIDEPNAIPSAAEWNPFVKWVAELPESKRMLRHRCMFDIAKNVLLERSDDGKERIVVRIADDWLSNAP